MKILLLNQTFYPDVAATAQQASELAASLVARGHNVTVICSRRAYDNPLERYPSRDVWRGVRIRRISCFGFGKQARWRRAVDFGSFLANCTLRLIASPRFDMVIAMTSPPLISWLGALFARVKGGTFVFWVMDLNPDEALAAGWLRAGSWMTKGLTAMLIYGLRQAALVVVLDRFMAQRVAAKGVPASKIAILPPWPLGHVLRYDAEGRRQFRRDLALDDKYVVMYAGNHSPCHPLTTLLEAARRLRGRDDIAFCFVGGGSQFDEVRRFARDHRLENIVTVPYQPIEKLAASLSAGDLHVVVMGDDFVGIVHPCKVYNIRVLGIPYLYIGPAESHVGELGPTFAANHGDFDSVARHIQAAADVRLSNVDSVAWTPQECDGHMVGRMVLALERAASPSTVVESEFARTRRSHQF